jgi:hypothetical protein
MKLLLGSRSTGSRARRGTVLVWALLISFVIATSSFVFATLSRSSSEMAELHRRETEAQALSAAAADFAVQAIEDAYEGNMPVPESGEVEIDGQMVAYSITAEDDEATVVDEKGLNAFQQVFRVEGRATVGRSQENTRTVVRAQRIPIFQFALFFENDMNFSRPPDMTVRGRVHSNSRIFVKTEGPLRFDTNYFGAVGGYYGSNLNGAPGPGTVSPLMRRWVEDPWDASEIVEYFELPCKTKMDSLGIPTANGYDSDFVGWDDNSDGDFLDSDDWLPFLPGSIDGTSAPDMYLGDGDGHTLRTGAGGLNELAVPGIESIAMFTTGGALDHEWDVSTSSYVEVAPGTGTHGKGGYHAAADLSIITKPDGTWKAYDGNGTDVTSSLTSIVTPTQMYDARQADGNGKKIQLTSIDLKALNSSGYFPANGLLYMGGYGAGTSTNALGFELKQCKELLGPLTVVSENSVYIRGDYNTTAKKPAAVIADAVNLLSNAWNNSKTPGNLPTASNTVYNLSVVTGDVDEISTGFFQGGAMNVLRRHERWTTYDETINGSIVCMFRSKYATGRYRNDGDYFRPPDRFWNYDQMLDSKDSLPPFTPQSIEVTPVVSW